MRCCCFFTCLSAPCHTRAIPLVDPSFALTFSEHATFVVNVNLAPNWPIVFVAASVHRVYPLAYYSIPALYPTAFSFCSPVVSNYCTRNRPAKAFHPGPLAMLLSACATCRATKREEEGNKPCSVRAAMKCWIWVTDRSIQWTMFIRDPKSCSMDVVAYCSALVTGQCWVSNLIGRVSSCTAAFLATDFP